MAGAAQSLHLFILQKRSECCRKRARRDHVGDIRRMCEPCGLRARDRDAPTPTPPLEAVRGAVGCEWLILCGASTRHATRSCKPLALSSSPSCGGGAQHQTTAARPGRGQHVEEEPFFYFHVSNITTLRLRVQQRWRLHRDEGDPLSMPPCALTAPRHRPPHSLVRLWRGLAACHARWPSAPTTLRPQT